MCRLPRQVACVIHGSLRVLARHGDSSYQFGHGLREHVFSHFARHAFEVFAEACQFSGLLHLDRIDERQTMAFVVTIVMEDVGTHGTGGGTR